MSLIDDSVIEKDKLNLDTILSILKNAGMIVEKGDKRIVIEKDGVNASLFFRAEVMNIHSTYNFKDGVDLSSLNERLIELNGTHSFTKTAINKDIRKLVISMNYLTGVGVFIPHFILTLNGFFAFQRIGFQKVDFSDVLI